MATDEINMNNGNDATASGTSENIVVPTIDTVSDYWLYCKERIRRLPEQKKNSNYLNNYQRYIKWIQKVVNYRKMNEDNAIEIKIEYNDTTKEYIFITQNNVELYFKHAVTTYHGTMSTIRNHYNSLVFYRNHYEHIFGTALVESNIISYYIKMQQYNVSSSDKFIDSDPHKGIKDIMSKSDIIKIITTIYSDRSDSLDLAFSFLWGINAGVRGSSSRAFKLCDLYASEGFGPDEDPPNNKTLMLILRKGKVHKDKHTTCRLVGVHRHRDYRLCTVFATALLVVNILRTDPTLNFKKSPKRRANWWDIPINRYKDYDQESHAMRDVLNSANVKSTKVTHHRYQAVQNAGANGLTMEQVQTITKHITNRLNSAYQPEVELECLKVMSGFKKVSTKNMFNKYNIEVPYL